MALPQTYPISFGSSNVGNFFWSWILKDCIKVQEKKKKVVVLCSRSQQNVKLGTLTFRAVVKRRLRNARKSMMHFQSCCFTNLNLLLFCRSRCRRRRRRPLLTVPTSRNSKTVARWNISYDCAHAWRSHGTGEETEKKLWVSQNWKLLFDCISAPKKIPPNVEAVATGSTSILVTWTKITNDSFLTGFTVKYTRLGDVSPEIEETVGKVEELKLQNLDIYTEYKIEVAARSTQDGKFSEAILVTTLEDGKLSFLYIFIWETF